MQAFLFFCGCFSYKSFLVYLVAALECCTHPVWNSVSCCSTVKVTKLAWFRNVLLKQWMVKGRAEFLKWSVSVSAALFLFSAFPWGSEKPRLERGSCSQHKCFSSSHLFSICGDSQNDLYLPLLHTHIAGTERERGGGGGAEIVWLRASSNLDGFWALQWSSQVHPQICGGGRASCCDSKYHTALDPSSAPTRSFVPHVLI